MTARLLLAMEAEGPSVPTCSMLAEGSHFCLIQREPSTNLQPKPTQMALPGVRDRALLQLSSQVGWWGSNLQPVAMMIHGQRVIFNLCSPLQFLSTL